jgi:PAN domain
MSKKRSIELHKANQLAPVIVLAVAICAGSTSVWAQSRAAIGCDSLKIDESSPADLTFDDIICRCFNKCLPPASTTTAPASPNAGTGVQPTSPAAASAPQAPSATADNRRVRMYEGRDVNGKDFKTLPRISFYDCINACKADRGCNSFSYDKWNQYCFLKNAVPTEVRIDPQSIVAVMSGATPVDASAPVKIEKYANAIFNDRPFKQFRQSSYGACQSACEADSSCEVFSFGRTTRTCNLISRPREYIRSPDVDADSGVKRQLPP